MRSISVCVGSSCHLRGAYDVVNEFKQLIAENSLTDQIELKACFCLGECQDGVSILVDGKIFTSLTKERVAEFFREHFLKFNSQFSINGERG
jgi:NADH:ubiquinone oxidoreductase subunit E